MKINLLCFGISREIIGAFEHSIDVSIGSSVADLRAELTQLFPDFKKLASLKFALDGEYTSEETILENNAEIVLIPPVSGG